MSIAVIVGLGNPGPEYSGTRHNIGFAVVDALATEQGAAWKNEKRFQAETAKVSLAGQSVVLMKPLTYVNDSGRALGAWLRFHRQPASAAIVAYDEINLELGRLKLSLNGSAGGHNGISSLLRDAGAGFLRYRIGIGGKSHPAMDLKDWVLGRFTEAENALITARMPDYLKGLHLLLSRGVETAMNQLNTRSHSEPA
ncbi:aminoacyl-tRNA hydrolase [Ruficoccus amylovorans]|uniref:Peptidyl-tRNA hydrolase n=1 Tax=Ruficoccus amylovorans TaxID=1804625 RepID=A0A842H925_9BACT|nr:aminoacyl-tRNA hydrolase [Ruficoccus amylovorans]MBC2592830.1 aminoacyl-tRNA hydrolase [Ruficoccus amylovorans]